MAAKGETDLCRHRLIKFCSGQGLDLGCGAVKIRPDAIGVDLYHPAADMHTDVRDLSCYPSGHFDYIYSSHMLEELQDTMGVLKEWLRIIKPGGYLVLYQADEDLYWKLGDSRCNNAHKYHFKWDSLWTILQETDPSLELVHHDRHPELNEWSFELVVRKPSLIKEAKPQYVFEGISILLPTLNRPKNIEDFTMSIEKTIHDSKNFEILFGIHEEDKASFDKIEGLKPKIKFSIRAEIIARYPDGKVNLSFLWNQLYQKAKYPIVGYFGDDVLFQTPGWDKEVKTEFAKDKHILVYGDDLHIQRGCIATLFFTHKSVHDAVGFYLDEKLRRWYMDTWWDNVFKAAGKIRYRGDLIFAHMHPDAFPDRVDDTYRNMEHFKTSDGKYMSSEENRVNMDKAVTIIQGLKS